MALFCDFENLALGVRDTRRGRFDVKLVTERLLSRGTIIVKKAYADWTRYGEYKREMHATNFELIEVPNNSQSGKNSADIRMVVDALDLCYTKEHVSTFVLITGDSDFSPLVSKLRENNKQVIGVGVRNSTSDLLVSNCDEFIFYDDLIGPKGRGAGRGKSSKAGNTVPSDHSEKKKESARAPAKSNKGTKTKNAETNKDGDKTDKTNKVPKTNKGARSASDDKSKPETGKQDRERGATGKSPEDDDAQDNDGAPGGKGSASGEPKTLEDAWDLLLDTLEAIFADRSDADVVWASMLKQSVKRRRPGFSEKTWGFRTFGQMIEAAEALKLIEIEKVKGTGNYRILGFGPEG